ncbi:acyltransferase Pun1 [Lactuca sativa]|uniref:Uncharacterized protein n=1 Tax=Lactuca sativa TaxID=4236 RepID=A0A9R1W3J3_LACSA|nr:acyltransferase Pun1 [Lactuca sativa]KAJ0216778.1 hypothetical protein LSAT_V11C300132770 [Lactuca sativa]
MASYMAKRAMKMEIITQEIVKPSSPTPNYLKTFKLSLLDQLAMHSYIPILLIYESGSLTNTDVLKETLSQTLTKYYPFAGRLRKDGITVDCGDQGVVFVEAKISGCGVADFLQNPMYETQKLLFPEGFLWKGSCIDQSFLAAQITSFEGGGTAVTVSISHKVADGTTSATFLSDWASMTRGEVRPLPMILARSIPSSDLGYTVPEIVLDNSTSCVTKRYVFDAKKIAGLKNSVMGLVENPTKVQVVTAYLYKCAIAASLEKTGCFRKSTLIQLVNMRPRMMPQLPENSIGNFSWYFTISNSDQSERSLSSLVLDLKEGIKEVCNGGDHVDLSDWLMDVMEYSGNVKQLFDDLEVYRCTSLCRRPFYQMDFGWGYPKWVTMADVHVKNTFVLFDTPDGDGIEAMVSLENDDMRLFQCNQYLLH